MSHTLGIDAASVFAFQQHLKANEFPVEGNPNYAALLSALRKEFSVADFSPKLAFVAVDLEHEGQKKFCAFLDHQGFVVDAVDYRDAFVLPDRSNPYQRLSTRLTYVLGLLASKQSHFVAVTDAFDTYYPILDYVQNRGGTATIAFFRSGMEPRWQRVGLFSPDSAVRFVDLDPYAKSIIGAELGSKVRPSKSGLAGLEV